MWASNTIRSTSLGAPPTTPGKVGGGWSGSPSPRASDGHPDEDQPLALGHRIAPHPDAADVERLLVGQRGNGRAGARRRGSASHDRGIRPPRRRPPLAHQPAGRQRRGAVGADVAQGEDVAPARAARAAPARPGSRSAAAGPASGRRPGRRSTRCRVRKPRPKRGLAGAMWSWRRPRPWPFISADARSATLGFAPRRRP